jgi:hypothetical protein
MSERTPFHQQVARQLEWSSVSGDLYPLFDRGCVPKQIAAFIVSCPC